MEKTSCITINCGCCGTGDTKPIPTTGDGTPIGTIISYMGTKVPMHYLACDGAVLNIADYPVLSQQVQREFGAVNYFDGDGITTFAVPDLRNEFLRGYHGEAEKQLTEEIGKHQEATSHLEIRSLEDGTAQSFVGKGVYAPQNRDTYEKCRRYVNRAAGKINENVTDLPLTYTSRPTNVAVLYCIKYE